MVRVQYNSTNKRWSISIPNATIARMGWKKGQEIDFHSYPNENRVSMITTGRVFTTRKDEVIEDKSKKEDIE